MYEEATGEEAVISLQDIDLFKESIDSWLNMINLVLY